MNKANKAARDAAYYAANKEKWRAYRKANKDKIAEYQRAYRKANKEKLAAQLRAWRATNKEKRLRGSAPGAAQELFSPGQAAIPRESAK